ncbi:hypothetical protein RhiirC2_799225 [Rhizophagus irregularis]|uniref:Uncharacterized protein n=1 Tax=Rhizophagus irregularis TaxID=588596 RepID=A0A2N1M588_9GLOM|nr:hypothetical protein RhiirC2_799225 [Rhizophagus irregularis]
MHEDFRFFKTFHKAGETLRTEILENMLYAAIKDLPEIRQVSFRKECIEIFNKHWNIWKQFDIELYILAFILHPKYHGN